MTKQAINQLDILDQKGLFSIPVERYLPQRKFLSSGKLFDDLCSTSYLSFDYEPEVIAAGLEWAKIWGVTTQWSRMEADCEFHQRVENKIAEFVGAKRVFLGHTVTASNFSHIPGIVQKGIIFADNIVHTVVWEACRLARDHGADLIRFKHQDMNHLEELLKTHRNRTPKLIAVDGVYSISTEHAPIFDLQDLAKRYDAWLYIDDAHGFGVVGEHGNGVVGEHLGNYERTFYVTSFNKAFSCAGAFTTIPDEYEDNIKAFSLHHLFSAPLSPFVWGSVFEALALNEREGDRRRQDIRQMVKVLVQGLENVGIPCLNTALHPVVFVEIGNFEDLLRVGKDLMDAGIFIGFRAYPVTAPDKCGVRLSITQANTMEQIHRVIGFFKQHASHLRNAA